MCNDVLISLSTSYVHYQPSQSSHVLPALSIQVTIYNYVLHLCRGVLGHFVGQRPWYLIEDIVNKQSEVLVGELSCVWRTAEQTSSSHVIPSHPYTTPAPPMYIINKIQLHRS